MKGKPGYSGSYTIPAGGSDSIGVKFTPSAEGPRIALLNVYSNAAILTTSKGVKSVDSIGIILEGIGVAPHLSVTWSNFGTIFEGSYDTTQICVTDTGSGEAIFSSQKFISGFTNQFKILTPLPNVILPESTACMTVQYAPDTTTGYEFVKLQLLTNAVTSDSDEVIELQGISTATANALFSPTKLFASTTVQTCGTPVMQGVVVTNSGSTALNITQIEFTSKGSADSLNYRMAPGTHYPIMVPSGVTDTLEFLFAPPNGGGGASLAQAVITSNNIGGGTNTITLEGTTQAEDAVSIHDSLFAGTLLDINATKTITDTLKNPGNTAVTITAQTIAGNGSAAYKIVSPFAPSVIPPGGMAVATVEFNPAGVSYIQPTVAELQVRTSSDCDSVVSVLLLARSCSSGVLPNPAAATVLFSNVDIPENQKASQTIFLENIGCDSITITSATLTGDATQYTVTYPKNAIAQASVDSVIVTFTPNSLGQKLATLTITTSAGNTYTYPLEATAGTIGVSEGAVPAYTNTLMQNYPNPFNPSTTIEYEMGQRGMVELEVLNTLGERVATLASGEREAGHYSAMFDASALPVGVYFYRLRVDAYTETRMIDRAPVNPETVKPRNGKPRDGKS